MAVRACSQPTRTGRRKPRTKEEALADIREGYRRRAYAGDRRDNSAPTSNVLFQQRAATLEEAVEKGSFIAGTPDDAIRQVEVLQERSGGIGGILGLAHEYASTEKTNRSYELWARYVAPRFQGQLQTIEDNRDWIEGSLATVFSNVGPAFAKAFEDGGKPVPEPIAKALAAAVRATE